MEQHTECDQTTDYQFVSFNGFFLILNGHFNLFVSSSLISYNTYFQVGLIAFYTSFLNEFSDIATIESENHGYIKYS